MTDLWQAWEHEGVIHELLEYYTEQVRKRHEMVFATCMVILLSIGRRANVCYIIFGATKSHHGQP